MYPTTAPALLSADQVAQYHRDGFVIISDLIDPAAAITWKETLVARLTEEGKINEPSGVRVWMADRADPVTASHLQSPRVIAILRQLIGPEIEFLSYKVVFKNGQTTFNSPWHQDWWYWRGSNKLSLWIALDDATPENGCLRLVPGSQKKVYEEQHIDDGKGFGNRLADEEMANLPVITAPVPRGGAVFFHDLTLHASCPNVNGQDRWSVIPTYRDATQPDSSTVWKQSLRLA
ncbi:MAG: phytanoyl-CoA dioxygenase family protein [Caldilineaceae bacterium]|nr:phytanoyl-CoA dioxygenase family protein [Caldilineaceae bacterium]